MPRSSAFTPKLLRFTHYRTHFTTSHRLLCTRSPTGTPPVCPATHGLLCSLCGTHVLRRFCLGLHQLYCAVLRRVFVSRFYHLPLCLAHWTPPSDAPFCGTYLHANFAFMHRFLRFVARRLHTARTCAISSLPVCAPRLTYLLALYSFSLAGVFSLYTVPLPAHLLPLWTGSFRSASQISRRSVCVRLYRRRFSARGLLVAVHVYDTVHASNLPLSHAVCTCTYLSYKTPDAAPFLTVSRSRFRCAGCTTTIPLRSPRATQQRILPQQDIRTRFCVRLRGMRFPATSQLAPGAFRYHMPGY